MSQSITKHVTDSGDAVATNMGPVQVFACGAAHELNNMLNAISNNLALADMLNGDNTRELARASKAAQNATELARKLMAFGQRAALKPEAFDLGLALGEAVKIAAEHIGDDIHLNTAEFSEVQIFADRKRFIVSIQSLINGAVSALDGVGKIHLEVTFSGALKLLAEPADTVEPAPPMVRISVADTRTGMTEYDRLHMFDPYFEANPHTPGNMDLAAVMGFALQSGGSISAETGVKDGAVVSMFLPVANGRKDEEEGSH